MKKDRSQELRSLISKRILALLEEKGLKQQELADKLGKNKGHISLILNAKQNLTIGTIVEIEKALGSEIIRVT